MRRIRNNQKGFTLIELMAVIAILAMIVLIAVPAVGSILSKAKAESDDASIALMERAGELAFVGGLEFDAVPGTVPEAESYAILTLIEAGYLNLDDVSGFHSPDNYVKKINKSGTFVFNGSGGGDDVVVLDCAEAEAQGYTCIYTPEEFDGMRDDLSGKYILMNDIDLAGYSDWSPIGTATDPFNGELHGNGMTVLNFTYGTNWGNGSYFTANPWGGYTAQGLFGYMANGTIRDIQLDNVDYSVNHTSSSSTYHYHGVLVGMVLSDSVNNPSGEPATFTNIRLNGEASVARTFVDGNSGYAGYFGGIVGYVNTDSDLVFEGIELDIVMDGGTGNPYARQDTVAGIAGYIDFMGDRVGSLIAENISVNGSISGYSAYGLFGEIYDYSGADATGTTYTLKNITVDMVLNGVSYANGVFDIIDAYNGRSVVIENVSVDGLFSAASVCGLGTKVETTESDMDVMDGVTVSATLNGFNRIAGVSSYIGFIRPAGETLIQNITVDSTINRLGSGQAPIVDSVFGQVRVRDSVQPVIVRDVNSTTQVTDASDWSGLVNLVYIENAPNVLFENISASNTGSLLNGDNSNNFNYYGFGERLDIEGSSDLTLRNVSIGSNVSVAGKGVGFIDRIRVGANYISGASAVIVDGVTLSGVVDASDHNNTGYANYAFSRAVTHASSLDRSSFNAIDATLRLTSESGDIFTIENDAHFMSYVTLVAGSPVDASRVTNLNAGWTNETMTGAVRYGLN